MIKKKKSAQPRKAKAKVKSKAKPKVRAAAKSRAKRKTVGGPDKDQRRELLISRFNERQRKLIEAEEKEDRRRETDEEPEREAHESLIPEAATDDLAEELGEAVIESATSGSQAAEDIRDAEVPEELGGPFVETSGDTEFARGTDASNPKGTKPAAFPTTQRTK